MHSETISNQRLAVTWAPSRPILVVDADQDTRALYRRSFERAGFRVVEASDGREALAKALVSPPAVVVTELSLPFVDGYALCGILRGERTTAHVPIVVVTTESGFAEMARARAGADVVLVKPAPIEAILDETRRLARDTTNGFDVASRAATPRR
jgi:two-component system cell cycle response regulator DivK